MVKKNLSIILGLLFAAIFSSFSQIKAATIHGLSSFGDLKYKKGFTHFDYVNPKAPKGGEIELAAIGSFDSLNPFIIKGTPAIGIDLLHCSLMSSSGDEPDSIYGYLATDVDISPDKKNITFHLNPQAAFSDGTPVTAQDVIFSLHILRKEGFPAYAQYYRDVTHAEALDPHTVRFDLKSESSRETPLNLGQITILSKAYYKKHPFKKASLMPPIGCGPYRIKSIDPGRAITYERKKNWWGTKIPSQVGFYNFDIHYNYYRDQTVMMEAFKSGDYDFRQENIAKNWATAYDFPAIKKGNVIQEELTHTLPRGMQMFIFNIRRPLFSDPRVRKALVFAFDFEWANKNLFFNAYTRTKSYFSNSELTAIGLPKGEELTLLKEYKDQLPPELFTTKFDLPQTKGNGNNRREIMKASKLLDQAGWIVKNGKRVNKRTGKLFTFEFLLVDPVYERVVLTLQRNLKRLGITMTTRTMTPSQYIERVENFDYDMISLAYPQKETPGDEQILFWSSHKADEKGSFNIPGIKNPIIDALIEKVVHAPSRESLIQRTRALDRVLLWRHYGIPNWHSKTNRIAYWNKFSMPQKKPKDGVGFMTWWIDPQKEKKLKAQ